MDPNDELEVLRTAMKECMTKRLFTFHDPKDPEADVNVLLDAWKEDKSMPFMHVGIRYGWTLKECTGHMIIVKNRIRPECQPWPVKPLLSHREITRLPCDDPCGDPEFDDFAYSDPQYFLDKDLSQEDLGGLLCCDQCHLSGCNFGGNWPQLGGANYLWLTPQLFNGLCRLGYNESEVPIKVITGALQGLPYKVVAGTPVGPAAMYSS